MNGAGTQAAIKAFQRDYRLVTDGIVGQKTWSKLLGLS
ncbi:MAG: peptidoglycan-binding domain-containing protein [[Clostridium] scindens]